MKRHRINLEITPRDPFVPFHLPCNGRVVSVIILGTESETGHGALAPCICLLLILNEISDGELAPFNPEVFYPSDGRVHNDSGIGDDDRLGTVLGLIDGSGMGGKFAHKEVLKGRVLFGVRGREVRHVNLVEVDKALDLAVGARLPLPASGCNALVVRPEPHPVRSVDPFCQRIEEEQELEFLPEGLLLAFELSRLAIDGDPAYFSGLDDFVVGQDGVQERVEIIS